jgi:hypothetical protein
VLKRYPILAKSARNLEDASKEVAEVKRDRAALPLLQLAPDMFAPSAEETADHLKQVDALNDRITIILLKSRAYMRGFF